MDKRLSVTLLFIVSALSLALGTARLYFYQGPKIGRRHNPALLRQAQLQKDEARLKFLAANPPKKLNGWVTATVSQPVASPARKNERVLKP